jgi:hypothetical protein
MYDYSLAMGDTVYPGGPFTAGSGSDTALFILTSIDTITQQGVARRRFSMMYDLSNGTVPGMVSQMNWIEGVGSTTHPIYAAECLVDFLCERNYDLLCYDSASVNLYLDTVLNTCDTVISHTSIKEVGKGQGFLAHWDPVSGELAVYLSPALASGNLLFMLIAMDGKYFPLRSSGPAVSGEYHLVPPSLVVGIYAVLVTNGNGMVAGQRIFIQ